MTHIKTSSGFEAEIDEEQLDDYRLMKAIHNTKQDPTSVVEVVGFVLGADEERLIDHVVAVTGRASVEAVQTELAEIFAQLGESKKK